MYLFIEQSGSSVRVIPEACSSKPIGVVCVGESNLVFIIDFHTHDLCVYQYLPFLFLKGAPHTLNGFVVVVVEEKRCDFQ